MKIWREIGSWVGSVGIAFVFALLIGIFLFQPYKVEGHSMDPTLSDKQRVYVSKLQHTLYSVPAYGDIVIIDSRVDRSRTFKDDLTESPLIQILKRNMDDHVFFVKRVIGKPGDVLTFKDGAMYRNGQKLNEPYINEPMEAGPEQTWNVPAGHVFVMGDNRNHSSDSRQIGFIPLDHVMGKKIF